jgi:hypothetical protein
MLDGQGSTTYDRGGTIEPMSIEYSGNKGQKGKLRDEYIRITGATSTPLMMKVYAYATGSAKVTYSWGESRSDCCTGSAACIGIPFTQPIAQNGILDVGEIPAGKRDVSIRLVSLDSSQDVDVQLYDITETEPFDEGRAIIAWCSGGAYPACNFGAMGGPEPDRVFYPDSSGPEYYYTGYNGQNNHLGEEEITVTGTTDRPLMMRVFGYTAGEARVTYTFWNKKKAPEAQEGTARMTLTGRGRERVGRTGSRERTHLSSLRKRLK